MSNEDSALDLYKLMFQAHPWHGVAPGSKAPETVKAYIEIVPTDAVKYELDKESGHLHVDRPQRFSSLCPSLYGFIPQTLCGDEVAALSAERQGGAGVDIKGDGDPMDICVLTEKTFAQGNFFVQARPIGGLRMIDGEQADDKIIAVLEGRSGLWPHREYRSVSESAGGSSPALFFELQTVAGRGAAAGGNCGRLRSRGSVGRDHAEFS